MATVIETIQENGREVLVYDNGAKKDKATGYWVSPPPSVRITRDNAREMLALRKAAGVRAQLAGLAKVMDLDPADVPEELIEQAGSALEAITTHMGKTFIGSRNLRGMGEVYDKLAAPLVGDRRERQPDEPGEQANIYVILAQLVSQYGQVSDSAISASNNEDVIDGTATDAGAGADTAADTMDGDTSGTSAPGADAPRRWSRGTGTQASGKSGEVE